MKLQCCARECKAPLRNCEAARKINCEVVAGNYEAMHGTIRLLAELPSCVRNSKATRNFEAVLQNCEVVRPRGFKAPTVTPVALVSSHFLKVKYLSDILMLNTGIQKLQLNSTGIGDEGAKAIAELLKKNSTLLAIMVVHLEQQAWELHLHGNDVGNEGIRALMSGLSVQKGKITLLDLGNNDIGPKGAFHVAEYIKKTKSLLWLNLYMNDIGDEGAERIADALKQNRTISTIDLLELGYNPIGPDGAKALCEVMKFHGKLETLKLGWCQIGAKGAEHIADALKYNTTLSTLDLRANGLGDDGAVCLARSLKIVNEALTSLDLGFNEIRDTGAFALAQALKANEDLAVTSLNLASNFLTKYGQVALSEAKDHVYEMSDKEISIYF
ncbi:RAN GTPase-activating protein 1 [Apostasia shenzhenica]|uniref:RAN GTPase-activating protein 1 n=1 Tax=Apostasia shenzhenica TaxID=1088818 RepID=A0A2H9ZX32_9ASPA|nr:RAN GTPase-activating protein 1 [Apostasia shenzhenica]